MTTATDNPKITEIRQSVADSYTKLKALLDQEISKLPAAKLYQAPAPNEWTVMQSVAHIIEIMPYWANEIQKLVAQPGLKFGRVMTDEARLKAISDHEQDELTSARSVLPSSYEHLDRVLSQLKDSDLTLTGVHSKFGEQNLEWFIHEFVTKHIANHLGQLQECLKAVTS